MYNKIFNPDTEKFISIYSKSGKKVLKRYIQMFGGAEKLCGYNYKTKHCSKKSGFHLVSDKRCKLRKNGWCAKKRRRCIKYEYK